MISFPFSKSMCGVMQSLDYFMSFNATTYYFPLSLLHHKLMGIILCLGLKKVEWPIGFFLDENKAILKYRLTFP